MAGQDWVQINKPRLLASASTSTLKRRPGADRDSVASMLDLLPDELPEAFRRVAEVIGMDAAAKLVDAFGGRRVYVPASATEARELTQVIGLEALRKLSNGWGRDQIQVPFLRAARIRRRDAEIRQRRAAGASSTSLAEEFLISERHVFTICASK